MDSFCGCRSSGRPCSVRFAEPPGLIASVGKPAGEL
jgi:hypothetical protein